MEEKRKKRHLPDAKQAFEIILFGSLIFLIACTYQTGEGHAGNSNSAVIQENGTIGTCFTMQEDCEQTLAALISSSASVQAALYDLDAPEILDALKKKGENVDILVYEKNHGGYGTAVASTDQENPGLMHDKIFILRNVSSAGGEDLVVTGSTNPTKNGFEKNANNMLIIRSPTLVSNYEKEWDEIREGKKNVPTRKTSIIFNSQELENYFCPEDGCESQVMKELRKADESVYFMTFSFTSDQIGKELIRMAREDCIEVKGVFDKSQVASNREYSEYPWMKSAGMDVKTAAGKDGKGKMHHKVFIIDNETVITGSYNPTESGNERNDENLLIIREPATVEEYIREFERIWKGI
ncbi:DUF1669 domain-containing protein [Candidatus Woesearchaeota archaeon]|nr:DUF1669 domain-containing protein [Candidatus Woesearchaeota archaeon]